MNHESRLRESIKQHRKRVRLLLAERYGLFGGSVGTVCAAALALLSFKYDSLINYTLWISVIALGLTAGIAYGLLRKLSDLSVALAVDKRAELRERTASAMAFLDNASSDWEQALITDASTHISSIKPREAFPHRFGRPHACFGMAAVVLLVAIFLPMMPVMQNKTKQQEVEVMKREGKKLTQIAKDIKKQAPPEDKELRKLAQQLEDLGKKMKSGRMDKKSAMLKTQRLSKEIKAQQDKLAKQSSSQKSMEQAQADMKKASDELAKKMAEKMAAEQKIPLSEAMKKLPTDERLKELARKEGPLTEAERKELEKTIDKYADPKSSLPVPPELAEAMAKLAENGNYQKATELMQKLAQRLAKMQQGKNGKGGKSGKMSEQDIEAMKKQMEALAKALKGTDLDKLAEQMAKNAEKLANMSDKELQELIKKMEEMQKKMGMLAKAGGG